VKSTTRPFKTFPMTTFPSLAKALARGEIIKGIVAELPERASYFRAARHPFDPDFAPSPSMASFFFGLIIEQRCTHVAEVDLLRAAAAISLAQERRQAESCSDKTSLE